MAGAIGPVAGAIGPVAGAIGPVAGTVCPVAGAIGAIAGACAVGPVAGIIGSVAGKVCPVAGAMGTVAWSVGPVHVTISPFGGGVENMRYPGTCHCMLQQCRMIMQASLSLLQRGLDAAITLLCFSTIMVRQ